MASNNPFVRIPTSDTTLNRIQYQISAAFNSLVGPFLGGKLLTGVVLSPSQDNLISHKLGRTPRLWVIAGQDTNANVWSPVTTQLSNQSSNAQFLNLWCSTKCTVSLWVN